MVLCRTLLLIIGLVAAFCVVPAGAQQTARERDARVLTFKGPLADAEAEISGMTWWKDQLLILPQFPHRFGGKRYGCLYTLSRKTILEALKKEGEPSLTPHPLRFEDRGIPQKIDGFEGYEAIAVQGRRAFLTIEASPQNAMRSYVVAGRLSRDSSRLALEHDAPRELPEQMTADNIAYEALVPIDHQLLAIYEANGANVNPDAVAYETDSTLHTLAAISFPTLEYRVTDATAPDENRRFWVMNFFYPGDRYVLNPPMDSSPSSYRRSFPFAPVGEKAVERLVELQYEEHGIRRTATSPLLLDVLEGTPARNWEGIARVPGQGILIATDTYPRTILAFVPYGGSK